ncbi:MAG TPA: YafY family protein [Polyangiales bacterium]
MLQTSARLLRLLTMLQARRSWSGRELVDRLEVTDRTLRRDVDRLRTLGYPVHSTSGTAGGYSLGAGASLPPLMLDDEEGVAVALALQTAGSSIAGIEDASQRALAKLEQVLPTRLRRRLKALRSSIVRLASRGPQVELEAVSQLSTACTEQYALGFGYRDHAGKVSRREVEPHRLVHMERRWYLVAWDRARSDWRTFRLDRIEAPLARGEPFMARESPDDDVASYVTRSVSLGPYRVRARVILRAPLAQMKAQLPPSAGVLEAIDGTCCRFVTAANSLEHVAVWLGLLDVDFAVEDPPELTDHLRRLAARLARAAGKPIDLGDGSGEPFADRLDG